MSSVEEQKKKKAQEEARRKAQESYKSVRKIEITQKSEIKGKLLDSQAINSLKKKKKKKEESSK